MSKIVIVGGGAAGMIAAITAAENGHDVHLFEKNEKFGKKIYITGKGRCNVTNACETDELFLCVPRNAKFLYSSFYGFTNHQLMDWFEEQDCHLKVERGNRVFPVSDHASDIIQTLVRRMNQLHVHTYLQTQVERLIIRESEVVGVQLTDGTSCSADRVVVTTGGLSYPATGSTGDGYRFAKEAGHKIVTCSPSLVPFNVRETWVTQLQGLALKNIRLRVQAGKKCLYDELGEMLFTHFGISGPLILSASSYVAEYLLACQNKKKMPEEISLMIDLKPALSNEQLDARVLREFESAKNKQFKNILGRLLPTKLIPVVLSLSGIAEERKINEITKEERLSFVQLLKKLTLTFVSLRGYQEAIITKGGISVKEVNPSTMESKLCRHLFFAGEVLDLDALTGGYNLQIAWSTGVLAAKSV